MPLRADELRKVAHGYVTLGQVQALVQELVDHAVAGFHDHRSEVVEPRHFAHPLLEIAVTLLPEVIVADVRTVHTLRDCHELERARPRLFYVITGKGEFEIWAGSGAHLRFNSLRFNSLALEIVEEIVVDRYIVPLVKYNRTRAQMPKFVVAEGDVRR